MEFSDLKELKKLMGKQFDFDEAHAGSIEKELVQTFQSNAGLFSLEDNGVKEPTEKFVPFGESDEEDSDEDEYNINVM